MSQSLSESAVIEPDPSLSAFTSSLLTTDERGSTTNDPSRTRNLESISYSVTNSHLCFHVPPDSPQLDLLTWLIVPRTHNE